MYSSLTISLVWYFIGFPHVTKNESSLLVLSYYLSKMAVVFIDVLDSSISSQIMK